MIIVGDFSSLITGVNCNLFIDFFDYRFNGIRGTKESEGTIVFILEGLGRDED